MGDVTYARREGFNGVENGLVHCLREQLARRCSRQETSNKRRGRVLRAQRSLEEAIRLTSARFCGIRIEQKDCGDRGSVDPRPALNFVIVYHERRDDQS